MTRFTIEKLDGNHAVETFDCGEEALNNFFVRHALQSQRANASQTYIGLADGDVIGFYSLAVGQIEHEDAPARVTKGLAHHPVPIMLLARLAIDTRWQGRGAGAGLLKDAMRRTLQAADIAGIRALVVHAKDDSARRFYEHFDFVSLPSEDRHLYQLIKDLRRSASV